MEREGDAFAPETLSVFPRDLVLVTPNWNHAHPGKELGRPSPILEHVELTLIILPLELNYAIKWKGLDEAEIRPSEWRPTIYCSRKYAEVICHHVKT